jgi:site-specific DNA recombinase
VIKVAIYARYSSDRSSIEDQFRLCQEYAKRQGWHLVESCSDQAISGASLLRPGIQTSRRGPSSKRMYLPLQRELAATVAPAMS